ncbi:MAG TPA: phenylacetate-CoA oxygenase subunit PaaJ [Burkholderiaceae bacterium]|nr:phenylacetate-CoA oxygenase subunit PaaJ [Burkholderiaceae bacterium]
MAKTESCVATNTTQALTLDFAWEVLHTVLDPEVPVLSICDLGMVRDVQMQGERGLEVVLTPTYSGCPATEMIASQAINALATAGFNPINLTTSHAPAWSSDWISDAGRDKLRQYGIAPPGPVMHGQDIVLQYMPQGRRATATLECPRCGSTHTECLSAFGSTACKALWRCLSCQEPFEHFKPF